MGVGRQKSFQPLAVLAGFRGGASGLGRWLLPKFCFGPSPVGVVFRGNHERAGWSWADAMRAIERNAEAEKDGPESGELPLAIGQGSELTYERRELTEGEGLRRGSGLVKNLAH